MNAEGPLVAVVDDEEPIRKALQRLLRSAGHDVETFASGTKFLNSLATHKPACIVLDIRMQGITGFDVQARLQADNIQVPIVFMTALDDPGDLQRAVQGGAFALLRKPFGDDELLAAIDGAIRTKGGYLPADVIKR